MDSQAWDYVNYYTDVKAWIPKNIVVVNKRAFRRLNKDVQSAILTAAEHAEKMGWEKVAERAASDKQKLIDNGMNVSDPSAKLISELQAIGNTWLTNGKQKILRK